MLADECSIELLSHTLESNAKEIFICLQNALSHRIPLEVSSPFYGSNSFYQTVIAVDNIGFGIIICECIVNLYVSSESHHFVTDGMLKS